MPASKSMIEGESGGPWKRRNAPEPARDGSGNVICLARSARLCSYYSVAAWSALCRMR